jgi:two-component system sensor histidine kinase TctE
MPDGARSQPSVRRRLLAYLAGTLLAVIVGVALVTYLVAHHAAYAAYDRSLLDPAVDIAEHVASGPGGTRVDLPQKAVEALLYDQVDHMMYQVRDPGGAVVAGEPDLPERASPGIGAHVFFDAEYHGNPIRVAALRTSAGALVQVSETLHKRHELVAEILTAEIGTIAVIALAALTLAWLGITNALHPLQRLRAQLLQRSISDLRPLSPAHLPVETAPVVDAFNALLAKLREASVMQQRFMANAAHQLRTPLAGLQMHLELLSRHELAPPVREEIDRLHGATVRASRLATQLLALARAETGPIKDRPLELVDLREVGGEAARDWAPRAIALDRDLGFHLESAVILGDRTLLPEILNNLIDNALRYTPSGGSITVRTGYVGELAYLSVEDTGPGIPEAERPNVLERFYRVSGSPGDGSGLGLSIVKEAAERQGAQMEIRDRDDGPGLQVRVVFPRLNQAPA